MNKISKPIRKVKDWDFFVAIGVNLFFLIWVFAFCDVKYEVSDDFIMENIVSGSYTGIPNPHMMFVNIVLGRILALLYGLNSQISWFFILHYFVNFLSFTIVTYILEKKLNRFLGVIISIIFISIYSNDVYLLMQFTKTATLAIMTGIVLCFHCLFSSEEKIRYIFLGLIMVILGTLIRFSCIFLVAPFLFFIFIKEFMFEKHQFKKKITMVYLLISILLVSLLLNSYDKYEYNKKEDYLYYREYSAVRSQIVDYTTYPYEEIKSQLNDLEFSENDYDMILQWNFVDDNYFTLTKLQQISQVLNQKRKADSLTFHQIMNIIKLRKLETYPIVWGYLLISTYMLLKNKRQKYLILGVSLIIMALIYSFAYMGRILYRIEYSIFVCGAITLLYIADLNLRKKKNLILGAILILFLKAYLYMPSQDYKFQSNEDYRKIVTDVLHYSWDYSQNKFKSNFRNRIPFPNLKYEMENSGNNFYFMDFSTTIQSVYYNYAPFKSLPRSYYSNKLYFSGITVNFPDVNAVLRENQFTTPIEALCKDNVYLIEVGVPNVKLKYLREHYYSNARVELYKEVDGFGIWKFYSN
jgi:hypothetical protein